MTTGLETWDERLRAMFGLALLDHPARLRDGLRAACRELALEDDDELLARVDRGDVTVKHALARALTIGETYFFREPQHFDLVREVLLPEALARGGRSITLVSAGCASGEEAYSLAIAARQALGKTASERVRVLGYDLNPRAIDKARRGVYRPWSLRGVPDRVKRRWFSRTGDEWTVRAEARARTRFECKNLVDPSGALAPASADVIFCRNVLMYLDPDASTRVLRALSAALAPGGVLILGSAEAALFGVAGLSACRLRDIWVHSGAERSVRKAVVASPSITSARLTSTRPGARRNVGSARRADAVATATVAGEPSATPDGGSLDGLGRADDALACVERGWLTLASDPSAATSEARRAILLDRRLAAAHVLAASAALSLSSRGVAQRALRRAQRYLYAAEATSTVLGTSGATAREMRAYCARLERALGGGPR